MSIERRSSSRGKLRRRSSGGSADALGVSRSDSPEAHASAIVDMTCELCGLDCSTGPRLRSKRTGAYRHQVCPTEEEARAMRKEMRRAEREASRRLLEAGDFDDNYFASPRASASPSGKTVRWREKVEGERRRDDRSPDRDRGRHLASTLSAVAGIRERESPKKVRDRDRASPVASSSKTRRRRRRDDDDGDDEHPPLPPRASFAIVGVLAAAAFAHFSRFSASAVVATLGLVASVAAVASAVEWKINLDPERLERAARDVAEVVVVLMGWAFVAVRAAAETSRDVVGDVVDALAAARVDAENAENESESEAAGSTPTTRPDADDDDQGAVEEARETRPRAMRGDDASASTRDASANERAEGARGKMLLVDPSEFRRVQIDLSEATDELGVVRRELDAARADAEVARSGRAAAVERAVHAANRQAETRAREEEERYEVELEELRRSIRRAADLAAAEERQRGAGDVAGLRDRIRELEAKATEAEDLARARDKLEQAARNQAAEMQRRLETAESRHSAETQRLVAEKDLATETARRAADALVADARQTAGSEVERARRETQYALETARRAAEEEASRLRAESERIARDWRLATERADAAEEEAASLLEAARAAEGMLRTQSEKATKLEKLAEENAAEKSALRERLEYAEWRLAKLGLGSDGVEEEEFANEFANLERRVKISDVLEKQRTTATSRGIEMGPSTDEDDFLDDLASSKKRLARTAFETSPARAVAAGIKKRVEALRAEEEARDRERGGVPAGKSHHHSIRVRRADEDLADVL